MTTTIGGSYPAVNSDSDATINGLTVGKGGGSQASNTVVGSGALNTNSAGTNNTAFGYQTLYNNTANGNNAFGIYALYANTTGTGNTAIGGYDGTIQPALRYNTTGSQNTAVGTGALQGNTISANNTAVGYRALSAYNRTVDTDGYVTAIGWKAGSSATTGQYSVYVGAQAGTNTTTGELNIFVGLNSGLANTTGSYNVITGTQALNTNTTASYNTAMGHTALFYATGGSNTAFGASAGSEITSGTKNTIVGRYNGNQGSLDIRTLSNRIVLSDGDGNPRLYITDVGKVAIGNNAPNCLLDITSSDSGSSYQTLNITNAAATSTSRGTNRIVRISSNASGADTTIQFTDNVSNNYFFGGYNGVAYVSSNLNQGVKLSAGATSWASDSDERLKNIKAPITNAVANLSTLRTVYGNYKDDADDLSRLFLIAQDVQKVYPEAIDVGQDEDKTLSLRAVDLIPVLVAAIKELKAEVDSLKQQLGK
jgi:hypothetical protein